MRPQDLIRPSKANWLTVVILMLAPMIGTHHATSMAPFLNEMGDDLGVSDATMGQLGTVTFAGAAIAALLLAPFISRYQLRGVLWVSMTVVGITTIATAVVDDFAVMVPVRIVSGLAGGPVFAGAIAAVGRAWPDPVVRRTRQGFVIGAAAGGPGIMTPILRLVGSDGNWERGLFVFGVFCLVAAALVFIALPKLGGTQDDGAGIRGQLSGLAGVFVMPIVGSALLMRVVANAMMIGTFVFTAGFYNHEYPGSDDWIGPAFAAAAVGFMISAFLSARVTKALGGPANATVVGTIAMTIAISCYVWITVSPAVSTVLFLLFGMVVGIFFNGLVSLIYEHSGKQQSTAVFLDGALGPIGATLGAALGGLALGFGSGYEGWKIYSTIGAAILLLPMLDLMRRIRKQEREKT